MLIQELLGNECLFLYCDIETGFLNLIKYPLTRTKTDPQAIEDVLDGQLYQKHFLKDGFF